MCRDKESSELQSRLVSDQSQFISIHGRRRVGKTFLVRSVSKQTSAIFFEVTGLKDGKLEDQLKLFATELSKVFFNNTPIASISSWMEAFEILTQQISLLKKKQRVIIFLDELPWLASRKSGLIPALDHFWNTKWEKINNFNLIICGSAASWMIKKIVNAKGGLHNRLTKVFHLEPFKLHETKQYLKTKKINFSNTQLIEIYLATGGIPHYLNSIQRGKSAAQNIDSICFNKSGLLWKEFDKLFDSLFLQSKTQKELIRAIAAKRYGISRKELQSKLKISSGGRLTDKLNELIESSFVSSFLPYGQKKEDLWYKCTDEYTRFYLRWIEPLQQRGSAPPPENYWDVKRNTPACKSWSGFSFEDVCLKHISQIRNALDLSNVSCEIGWWRISAKRAVIDSEGAQIDLLFDRNDGVITVCEIKYSDKAYTLTKEDTIKIKKKIELFQKYYLNKNNKNKSVTLALITANGLKKNTWSEDLIDHIVTVDDLIKN